MSPTRRIARALLELGPPFVVAVVLLPWIIAYGTAWPWNPSTIDLQVYVYAVRDMVAGGNIYATSTPGWNLLFIYPPIAAVLMAPLALGPYVFWQLAWTLGLIWAQQSVLVRCGVPRGWKLALVGAAVVIAMEPIRTTLGYGQVNTILMALVFADLVQRPSTGSGNGKVGSGTGWRGVLIGLAAAIKLTPALFVVFAFAAGKRRLALTAIAGFVGFTLLGAIFQWSQSLAFWTGLATGRTGAQAPLYVGNQSLLGVFHRLGDDTATITTLAGLGFAGLVALLGTFVAAQWWADGEKAFAVSLVGLCTCLASPLSWTHHYVWILPLGAVVLLRRSLPRWVRILGGAWVVWVSLCLPLAVLPYAYNVERTYDPLQQLVANLGPALGVALIIGLGWRLVRSRRAASTPAVDLDERRGVVRPETRSEA